MAIITVKRLVNMKVGHDGGLIDIENREEDMLAGGADQMVFDIGEIPPIQFMVQVFPPVQPNFDEFFQPNELQNLVLHNQGELQNLVLHNQGELQNLVLHNQDENLVLHNLDENLVLHNQGENLVRPNFDELQNLVQFHINELQNNLVIDAIFEELMQHIVQQDFAAFANPNILLPANGLPPGHFINIPRQPEIDWLTPSDPFGRYQHWEMTSLMPHIMPLPILIPSSIYYAPLDITFDNPQLVHFIEPV